MQTTLNLVIKTKTPENETPENTQKCQSCGLSYTPSASVAGQREDICIDCHYERYTRQNYKHKQ